MSDKIKELLALPDLPEGEQWEWVCRELLTYDADHSYYLGMAPVCCLADLAFRLRVEVIGADRDNFRKARVLVAKKSCTQWQKHWGFFEATAWWVQFAQPIHWIIAALIAKELNK